MLERRTLGQTGLKVSVLGLGAAEIGQKNLAPYVVQRLIDTAFEAGINVVDTAECYQDSEEKLGNVLAGRRQHCVLLTKCGHDTEFRHTFPIRAVNKISRAFAGRVIIGPRDFRKTTLQRNIESSLQHLRTDYIDVLQLHSSPLDFLRQGDVIEVLQKAKQAGHTRFIGYSGDGQAARFAIGTGVFDTLQTSTNIADQACMEQVIPDAQRLGMGIIAKRTLANAVWTHREKPPNSYHHVYWERLRVLNYDFLAASGTAASTALRFTLSVPGLHTALVGASTEARVRTNAGIAAEGRLDDAQFRAIRDRWQACAEPDWVGQE